MSFLYKFFLLLGIWFLTYYLWLKPLETYDTFLIHNLTLFSGGILQLLGFNVNYIEGKYEGFFNSLGLQESAPVIIGPECDGLVVIFLFIIFIISYPGSWKKKLWYIPLGSLLLFIVNGIRISALAWILKTYPEWLQFNHDYTFTILVYGVVFGMWVLWVKKFSTPK